MKKTLAKELLQFIEKSPSTYHVIENVRRRLLASGYTELEENARWSLVHGGKYFLTRGRPRHRLRSPPRAGRPAGQLPRGQVSASFLVLLVMQGAGCISGNGTQDAKLNIIDDNYRNYYEIFVGSFYDSDGDGMGDLKGVEEKLDYISDLGCNGIWLMPIMPSPTYHKYDTTDYEAVDEAYGTADDFKELASACHEKGIRLIIDVAMNHSSSQHPWFTQACEYLAGLKAGEKPDDTVCPYVDYYHFSDKQEGTTYYAVPGSSSWWYEGSFWSEMPDLNLKSPAVQKEFEEVADYWIDLGVDGFRMDAAMHYEENATNANCDILNKLYTYCKEKNPQFYMVSEVWASENVIADYYASGTPSMFNFDAGTAKGALVNAVRKGDPVSLVNSMLKYQNDFSQKNPDYIDAPFLSNHDMARIANTLVNDPDKIKTAAGLLMTMNGSPFVYYGEEIGMNSSGTKDENKRIPMVWSKTDTTGMTKGPADMDAGIESPFPAEDEQEKDKDSILSYYKNALRLRNQNPEIARGTIEKVESLCKDSQAAITKTYQDSTIGIVYNLGEGNGTVDLKKTALENMNLEGSLTLKEETVQLKDGKLEMPACSIAVLK